MAKLNYVTPVVIAKCVVCGAKREIQPGEVEAGDMPFCRSCGNVMIADSAKTRSVKR